MERRENSSENVEALFVSRVLYSVQFRKRRQKKREVVGMG